MEQFKVLLIKLTILLIPLEILAWIILAYTIEEPKAFKIFTFVLLGIIFLPAILFTIMFHISFPIARNEVLYVNPLTNKQDDEEDWISEEKLKYLEQAKQHLYSLDFRKLATKYDKRRPECKGICDIYISHDQKTLALVFGGKYSSSKYNLDLTFAQFVTMTSASRPILTIANLIPGDMHPTKYFNQLGVATNDMHIAHALHHSRTENIEYPVIPFSCNHELELYFGYIEEAFRQMAANGRLIEDANHKNKWKRTAKGAAIDSLISCLKFLFTSFNSKRLAKKYQAIANDQ